MLPFCFHWQSVYSMKEKNQKELIDLWTFITEESQVHFTCWERVVKMLAYSIYNAFITNTTNTGKNLFLYPPIYLN